MEKNNPNLSVNPSVTSPQSSSTTNPIHNQKSLLPIILGVLVLLVVVGGVAYYLGTLRNQDSSQIPQQSTIPSAMPQAQNSEPNTNQVGSFEKSQIVFEKDIPSSNKKLIVFNTKNNVEGFDSELYITNINYDKQSAKKVDVKLSSFAEYEAFVSPSKAKSYVVLTAKMGDGREFYIIDSDGNLISDNVVQENSKAIGYNVKFGCQCDTRFKNWNDNTHFALEIVNANDEEYEIIVDAITGIVNESSFKKIK